ncbi:unnamed protein product [Rhizophagus irregularis]|nr:unnamed protein product [Rhizophagus irregularis]
MKENIVFMIFLSVFLTDKRFGYGPEHATSPFTTDQTSSIGCSSQCSKSSGFLNSSEKAISYACNQSIISCFFVLKCITPFCRGNIHAHLVLVAQYLS